MRKYIFLIIFLSGCAYQETLDTWNGYTEKDLLTTWGAPSSVYETDGGKILKYSHSRIGGTTATEYYCNVNFFLNKDNVIIKSIGDGNIGGCNRLIKKHPD